jgi:hypothetical protein
MQTMRVPVGRVPQIKHTGEGRKIPFIKNACNNFDLKKQVLSLTESITKVNDKVNAVTFRTTEKRVHDRQNDRLKLVNK